MNSEGDCQNILETKAQDYGEISKGKMNFSKKIQQQKYKIPRKVWVPRSLQFNKEGGLNISEHVKNTQGNNADELLKFIRRKKKSTKETS